MKKPFAPFLAGWLAGSLLLGGCGSGGSDAPTPPPSGKTPPPAVPTGLTASASDVQINLAWSAVSAASTYRVKRATASGGPFATIQSNVGSSSNYSDTDLTDGTTYYYVVSASNASGESGDSNQASAVAPTRVPPAPDGVVGTPGDSQVVLTWNAVKGATNYTVYRDAARVGSPKTNGFTDIGLTNGVAYAYQVGATNKGGEGAKSAGITVTPAGTPSTDSKPGPTNTGVPPGTQLTEVHGDQVYSIDNQVISGVDVYGYVQITGKNVTIKNSRIRGGIKPCTATDAVNSAALWIRTDTNASATIQDTEIWPSNPTACLDGVWASNATLLRMNIHGSVDGVKVYDNVTVQDSYIHDLTAFAYDPNQTDGTHNDGLQTYEGNRNIHIIHNNIALVSDNNAAYQVTQDGGKVTTDLHIENNWLDGGGCTLNFGHKGGPTPMTGIYVLNNRFGPNSFYNCPILISTQTILSQNSGNVWDSTGQPIPPPQQHD